MKFTVDGVDLFELTETQKKVIKNEIISDAFEEDMKRRIQYIIMHKYEQCFKRLKNEWDTKLEAAGIESIPTNKDAYAELIFKQANYKDRSTREAELKAAETPVVPAEK